MQQSTTETKEKITSVVPDEHAGPEKISRAIFELLQAPSVRQALEVFVAVATNRPMVFGPCPNCGYGKTNKY